MSKYEYVNSWGFHDISEILVNILIKISIYGNYLKFIQMLIKTLKIDKISKNIYDKIIL